MKTITLTALLHDGIIDVEAIQIVLMDAMYEYLTKRDPIEEYVKKGLLNEENYEARLQQVSRKVAAAKAVGILRVESIMDDEGATYNGRSEAISQLKEDFSDMLPKIDALANKDGVPSLIHDIHDLATTAMEKVEALFPNTKAPELKEPPAIEDAPAPKIVVEAVEVENLSPGDIIVKDGRIIELGNKIRDDKQVVSFMATERYYSVDLGMMREFKSDLSFMKVVDLITTRVPNKAVTLFIAPDKRK